MPNTELLRAKMRESGMTVISISEKSGVDRATIYNRLNGRGEWLISEVVGISNALKLTNAERDEIFLM